MYSTWFKLIGEMSLGLGACESCAEPASPDTRRWKPGQPYHRAPPGTNHTDESVSGIPYEFIITKGRDGKEN